MAIKIKKRTKEDGKLENCMCKILLEGANEWKKMGRRSII
ncbi:hypothetical protein SB48_HM08orf06209 [Heyndrickxia coagulans]|uniref:Uncharacterized protein n=1 Tax=Heyndrickxia coagulans TaxID=1398 RepID=A0AAN0WDQ7_HEYCO|nr:hypothetical protein SB48_HM08orf06209 [Heyndrickxia coagulans]